MMEQLHKWCCVTGLETDWLIRLEMFHHLLHGYMIFIFFDFSEFLYKHWLASKFRDCEILFDVEQKK